MCRLHIHFHACVCVHVCACVSEDLAKRKDEVMQVISLQDADKLGTMGSSLPVSDGVKHLLHSLICLSVSPKSLLFVVRRDSSWHALPDGI